MDSACVLVAWPVIALLSQLLRHFVVGVRPLDLLSLQGGVSLPALATLVTALIPARRAAPVAPLTALSTQ